MQQPNSNQAKTLSTAEDSESPLSHTIHHGWWIKHCKASKSPQDNSVNHCFSLTADRLDEMTKLQHFSSLLKFL
jgi:hypothetical protein